MEFLKHWVRLMQVNILASQTKVLMQTPDVKVSFDQIICAVSGFILPLCREIYRYH